jgi:hypothetical protein
VPVQSFTPVLVKRKEAASGSLPALVGDAITLTHSAMDNVPPPEASQVPAESTYPEFERESPENVLNGTEVAVTPPHAVLGEGALGVAVPDASVVKPK